MNKTKQNSKPTYTPSEDCDALQPQYLFSNTWTELLVAIANGSVDAQQLAKQELANRGLNQEGTWVGFNKAAELIK